METVGRHFSQRAAVPPASSVEPKNPITTLPMEVAYKIDGERTIYIWRRATETDEGSTWRENTNKDI
jgi:hypothetical protein